MNIKQLNREVQNWADTAASAGWIDHDTLQQFRHQPSKQKDDLFAQDERRPLLVAFMGGTGVGKSALLNKLAQQTIAKSSAQRPTSHEVTLYCHQALALNLLEDTFPVAQTNTRRHNKDEQRHIVWLDMPDIDSVERKNRDLTLRWLEFVDVLVYVVSPERYSDSKPYQLLLAQKTKCAWVFAFNQWDQAVDEQYPDFARRLASAGFADPLIFKTISTAEQAPDQLPQLQDKIVSIASLRTLEYINSRDSKRQIDEVRQQLASSRQKLGSQQDLDQLLGRLPIKMQQLQQACQQRLSWAISTAAKSYAKNPSLQSCAPLWDDWAQSLWGDFIDDLALSAGKCGLPAAKMQNELASCRDLAGICVQTEAETACCAALVNPGNIWQRVLLKYANIGEKVLPLLALLWVGWRVFSGYYQNDGADDFLGIKFAIHSTLLVLISWLLPWFINKKMQPSLENTARAGLQQGLDAALRILNDTICDRLANYRSQHAKSVQSLDALIANCKSHDIAKPSDPTLDRMML